jgi:hypothetical protein
MSVQASGNQQSGPVLSSALAELIRQLRIRGVPVVAWVRVRYPGGTHGVVLIGDNGRWIGISYARLGRRWGGLIEEVAQELGATAEPELLAALPELPPEIDQRTWAWWRYLRWQRERVQGERDAC